MSAIDDFAKMPPRKKAQVFAVGGLMLGLLYYQFVFKGLAADIEDTVSENASKNATNASLERDIPAFEALKSRVMVLKRVIEENQKALPTEAELPAFFETLNRKVLESGVEVVRSKQLTEETVDRFIRVPVEYEIVGTYVQIKKFFASLVTKKKRPGAAPLPDGEVEERERIVSIDGLSLTNPTVKNREIVLTAKFVASTYRMEDRSEIKLPPSMMQAPAGGPPGAAGKKGGS